MKTKHKGLDKKHNESTRITVYILGFVLFISLFLLPLSISFAKDINKISGNLFTVDEIKINRSQNLLLPIGTFVPAPTNTPTGTTTPGTTNTATPTSTPTGTSSSTPTGTQTPLGTPTQTATTISTSTMTATPTKTGTLAPGMTIDVSVSPNQAKVNQSLTFTIGVKNIGNVASTDNIVVDSFPTFINVLTVTTSRGTITKLTHSFIATIGGVDPGDVITIASTVRVNSTLTRSETLSNVVTLTYDQTKSKNDSVTYKVVYESLPPTGDLPLNWRQDSIRPIALLPGILIFTFGSILLGLAYWSKAHFHKDRLWMTASGIILIFAGFVVGGISSGLFSQTRQPQGEQVQQMNTSDVVQQQSSEPTNTTIPWRPASAFSTPDSVIPIVTLPDYPIPTPVITITPQPGEPEPDTSAVVRIVIPALMLDNVVKYVPYDGYSWMIEGLRQEIAWMGNTSWPGLGSNTGLAGHVTVAGMGDGPFRHLDELPSGELVILYTENNIYTYQVRTSRVTDAGDMSVILPTDNPQISLITCVDWDDDAHTYLNRLIVIADLIRTESITMGYSR